MNLIQIIAFIGANLILATGLILGTIMVVSHQKERILTNRFSYGLAMVEYVGGIIGFLCIIYIGFGRQI